MNIEDKIYKKKLLECWFLMTYTYEYERRLFRKPTDIKIIDIQKHKIRIKEILASRKNEVRTVETTIEERSDLFDFLKENKKYFVNK